jgi:hypothetical protein
MPKLNKEMLHAGQGLRTLRDDSDNHDSADILFDPDSMWFVRPQLFFHCTLHLMDARVGCYNCCDKDIQLDLPVNSI